MSTREDRIHELEAQGRTGKTNAELHALNCAQTDALSDDEIRSLIHTRASQGKPIGKLVAAARDRDIDL